MPALPLPLGVWLVDASIGGHAPKRPPRPGIMVGRRWVPRGEGGWWEARVLLVRMGAHDDTWVEEVTWVRFSELVIAEPAPTA